MTKFIPQKQDIKYICVAKNFRSVKKFSKDSGIPLHEIKLVRNVEDVKGLPNTTPVIRYGDYWELHGGINDYLKLMNYLNQNYFSISDWDG